MTVLSDLFTREELAKLVKGTSYFTAEFQTMEVKKLTIEQLTDLGIPLMQLEGRDTGTGNPLSVDAITILIRRASDRDIPFFSEPNLEGLY